MPRELSKEDKTMTSDADLMKIVVAMPALNEEKRVKNAIASLLKDPSAERCIFVLIDGGSSDKTKEVVKENFGAAVLILPNPERIQSHAMNIAARYAIDIGAKYLIRADLHAVYPEGFITGLVETAEMMEADSVVVRMKTVGGNGVQNGAALAFGSWIGTGGSPHRAGKSGGWVDHGHHALFSVEAYVEVGGYDTDFVANEDAEFDVRLKNNGGKIYLDSSLAIEYIPRSTYLSTLKQYFRNGRYRIWTAAKHRRNLGARQIIPLMLCPAIFVSFVASFWISWALIVPVLYISSVLIAVVMSAKSSPIPATLEVVISSALVSMCSHVGFSAGGVTSLVQLFLLNPSKRKALTQRSHPDLRTVKNVS